MIVPAIGFEPEAGGWAGFAPGVQRRLERQGVNAASYERWRNEIATETDARERDGEGDHLIHYALLSRSFTRLPPIEPAVSARQFVESGHVPKDAAARLVAFWGALRRADSERLREFKLIAEGRDSISEYRRTMRFLYAKEFQNKTSYAARGHSTDTSVAANYAVWHGLNVLRAMAPDVRIQRVLIVGPGLDFAPRTDLIEAARPQSYQPFAVLDALLALKLSQGEPVIHCLDINARVIRFFEKFGARPVLVLQARDGNGEYLRYFNELGSHLGTVSNLAGSKTIGVSEKWARSVTVERRNVVTDDALSGYDLAIATNVLLYYEGAQLTAAVAHIARSLSPGGYLLHNDLRPELDGATHAAGLGAVAARTVQISATTFDSFALYRR